MNKSTPTLLAILQIFIAIMAIPAGLSMILTPDGSDIGIPLGILVDSPFKDFLIPGLFLCFVLGLLNIIGVVLTFRRSNYASRLAIILGLTMIIWILIQVYFIRWISFLQPLFLVIGIAEMVLGKKLLKLMQIIP